MNKQHEVYVKEQVTRITDVWCNPKKPDGTPAGLAEYERVISKFSNLDDIEAGISDVIDASQETWRPPPGTFAAAIRERQKARKAAERQDELERYMGIGKYRE